MKKIIILILFMLTQMVQAELPEGDFTLVTAKGAGAHELSFISGKIEKEDKTEYLDIPHLGRTEILASAEGDDFHAIYLPRTIKRDGKEYEQFSVIVVSITIAEKGKIYVTFTESLNAYSGDRTQYTFKRGKLE